MAKFADTHSGERKWFSGRNKGYRQDSVEKEARDLFYKDFRVQQKYTLIQWVEEYRRTKGKVYRRKFK